MDLSWMLKGARVSGDKVDHLVFVHAVRLIYDYESSNNPATLVDINNAFVYLLLQRNQLTGEQHEFDHKADDDVKSSRYLMLESSLRKDIERSLESGEYMRPYHLMQMIQLISRDNENRWRYGEIPALLILSSWLLTRHVIKSVDVTTCQRCASLVTTSHMDDCAPSDSEFTSAVPGFVKVISSELDRICLMYENIQDVVEEFACLGCFAALVKACRMVRDDDPLRRLLHEEFEWVHSITTK